LSFGICSIINSQKHKKDSSGIGYGIVNCLSQTHTVTLENNCLYNNTAGNYKSCTSQADIYVNPLLADLKNHDYHCSRPQAAGMEKTGLKIK
jgi:hypothetical protein